jgi:hypothetical protein
MNFHFIGKKVYLQGLDIIFDSNDPNVTNPTATLIQKLERVMTITLI